VDLRVGLDAVEKRRILHCRESNRGHSARRYTDCATPTPLHSEELHKLQFPSDIISIVGPGYQPGCIILRIGNLAD
jgi:hypothetical protein